MRTPMQEHIEWLKSENKKYTEKAQEESSMQILGYAFKMRDCIKHAESMLEKEEGAIYQAWIDGESGRHTDPKEYYNETFNAEEK